MGGLALGSPLTRRLEEFVAVAEEYCRLYERAAELDAASFLTGLERVLPRLHAAGVGLGYEDPGHELPDDDVDVRLTVEERQTVDAPVHALLGELDWKEVQRDLDFPVGGAMLFDDLSDIYADLTEGFRLLEAGRPQVEARFVWHNGFWSHWGYHSASALLVVHRYAGLYLGPL